MTFFIAHENVQNAFPNEFYGIVIQVVKDYYFYA